MSYMEIHGTEVNHSIVPSISKVPRNRTRAVLEARTTREEEATPIGSAKQYNMSAL